jgi:hypothetical protein
MLEVVFASDFERFRIYNFGFEYPRGSTIHFGKRASRSRGYVTFVLPDASRIVVSWGRLDSVAGKFTTPEAHAAYSISRLHKSNEITDTSIIRRDNVNVHGHSAAFTHAAVESGSGPFSKNRNRDIMSLHVHCTDSGRYFVLDQSCALESSGFDSSLIFERVWKSFACH